MIDELTYPLPRRRRAGPPTNLEVKAASSGAVAATPPRSRYFPWIMALAGATRRTLSTPTLVGPAILKRLNYYVVLASDPPQMTLEIGWSPTPVTEAGVALTTPRPYTPLIEKLDPFGVTATNIGGGILNETLPNTHVYYQLTLDLIVTEAQFAFTLSWVNPPGFGGNWYGQISVLENVNADALNLWTGS